MPGAYLKPFFFYQRFLHRHWRFTGQEGKGGDHVLFHSTTSTRSRHLFATLHVRWLSRIFNRNACVYQTATRWNLPTYRIAIWVIDWWCNVCLFTWWIDTRFSLQRFDIGIWHLKPCQIYKMMRHIENPGNSQNSLFRHFQGYSGTFSNIQPCSGTLRDIKSYWGISVIFKTLLPLYTTIPYSELWHI